MNKETQVLLADVRRAAGELPFHQFIWIIDAAIKHFRGEVKRCEEDILRHDMLRTEEYCETGSDFSEPHTRASIILRTREALEQYRKILHFLFALKKLQNSMSAEKFANDFLASIGKRRR